MTFKDIFISKIRQLPEDILQEVSFYVGGGSPQCSNKSFSEPTLYFYEDDLELRDFVWVLTCGWQINELVNITLAFPDGQSISEEIHVQDNSKSTIARADSDGSVSVSYRTSLKDPAGAYTFLLESVSGRVQHSIYVTRPDGPRLYDDGDQLLLHNFSPNEHVRLFVYQATDWGWSKGTLVGCFPVCY